ncbi:MAG: hypothetical protein WA810_10655 [Maribacter sp.]
MSNTDHNEIGFIKDGPWDSLYVLTQHWESDLEFYTDDSRFLYALIDKYFIWVTKSENLDSVKKLMSNLCSLRETIKRLLGKTTQHRVRLGYLVENPKSADTDVIKNDHQRLEAEMADVVKLFRSNRKDIFEITEFIIDSEKLEYLMKA